MDSPQSLFPPETLVIKKLPLAMAFVITQAGICREVLVLDKKIFPGEEHFVGKAIAKSLPPAVGECLPEMIEKALVSDGPQSLEFPLAVPSSSLEQWFVARCLRLPGSSVSDPLLLWYAYDITDDKTREVEFSMYRDHLEEMVELRTAEQQRANVKLREEIARHEQTTKDLALSRERLDLAIRGAQDGIWDWDLTHDTIYFSPQWKKMLGFGEDEILEDIWEWSERIHPRDFMFMLEKFGKLVQSTRDTFAVECRMYHTDGSIKWIDIKGAVHRDTQGAPLRLAGTCTDVTERKQMENISSMLLQIANAINTTIDLQELYAAIHSVLLEYIEAKNFYIALVDEDNDRIVFPYCRDETTQIFTPLKNFSTTDVKSSTLRVIRSGQSLVLSTDDEIDHECQGIPAKIWIGIPLKSRNKVIGAMAVQHYTSPGHDTSRDVDILKAVSAQIALVIERKINENLLAHQAMHDALTTLPNRVLLRDRVGQALRRAHRNHQYHFALVMIDLDRFKFVNDCHGHQVGDRLLQDIAIRIQGCLRSIDTLARLGGDEFAILFEELGTSQKIIHKIKEVQKIIREPVNLSGYDIRIDSSVGIILKTHLYSTVDDLLRDADIAMYQAKSMGPGRLRVFSQSMHRQAMVAMSIEQDLRKALEKKEFYLEYQPVINLEDLSVDGFEALIRWRHPRKGIIPPDQFIPVAEDIGIIREIGLWVFEEACRTLSVWKQEIAGIQHLSMAINLSAKQLSCLSLLGEIKRIMQANTMKPGPIILEITETAILEGPRLALSVLRKIKEYGFRLALDDFGTGYSSLSYLHSFPTDFIKIDRSFISHIHEDDESLEIVRAIVVLGNSLNLHIIAEGIEMPQQYEILKNMGCEQAQGFLFSRPLSRKKSRELLEHPGELPWADGIVRDGV